MPNNQNQNLTAQDILHDCLSCEKHLTHLYNDGANEATNPQLRQDMLNILMDEHNLEASIYNVMQQRGMYQVQPADTQSIAQAQQKYTNPQQQQNS